MTEIGGFFASLKLKSDSASFAKGKKDLDEVAKSAKGLKQEYSTGADSIIDKTMKMGQSFMGLAGALAKFTAGMAGAMAALAGMGVGAAKSAESITGQGFRANMSATMANRWRLASQISGGSPDALMAEMGKVNQTFQSVDFGNAESYGELMKSLSFMGLTQEGLRGLADKGKTGNVDELMRTVLTWAGQNMKTPAQTQKTYQNVLDAFGPEMAGFIQQAQAKGVSPMAFYNDAASIAMRSGAGFNASNKASMKYNEIGASLSEVTGLIGDDINKQLLPYLTKITDWFKEHKKDIEDAADLISRAFGGILFTLDQIVNSPIFQAFAKVAGGVAQTVGEGLAGQGPVRGAVDSVKYWFMGGEADPRKTAYDLGLMFPGPMGKSSDIQDPNQRAAYEGIQKGYAGGKPFTLNINIDGKKSSYLIDPSAGTEKLVTQGATR
jgi:hypothetical protein